MAEAIILGSILASGASAAAGAGMIATAGIAGVSFGTIASGLSLAGTAFSMFEGMSQADAAYDAQVAASRAQMEATRVEMQQADVDAQRVRTQAAVEDAERQRRLRRTLASQRARFAGGGVDLTTGTPVSIQETTAGEINREGRLAGNAINDTLTSLSIQKTGIQAAGLGKAQSMISSAEAGLSESRQTSLKQLGAMGGMATDFKSTLKGTT